MKKFFCFVSVLAILIGCLSACSFPQKMFDNLTEESEAMPKAEEMLLALAENRLTDAEALLHPSVSQSGDRLSQIADFLAGRKSTALTVKNITINGTAGTAGKARKETLTYQVTLSDDTVVYISVVHLTDRQGSGFTTFQLTLGI